MQPEYENIIQIFAALAAGALLGIEREYHSKPAGFRTMILISVSSCLFTILSVSLGGSDRIASNIVTGIGFIGAGVVFKEGANVKGITSAATIWMAAAIGMAIGLQHYILAAVVLGVVLLVLLVLFKLEVALDNLHQLKVYTIRFCPANYTLEELEKGLHDMVIPFTRVKTAKQNSEIIVEYIIDVSPAKRAQIETFLVNNAGVTGFEV